jgi:hypothetical protein
MTKTKSKLLFLSLTGFAVISVVIAAGILIYQNSLKAQAKKVVDESVLYLGVPYKNDNQTVDLIVTAKSPSGTVTKTFGSGELQTLAGQDESIRFYDYAAEPLISLGSKTVGAWLANSGNSLQVKTVGDSLVTSKEVSIDKSGIWMINVAAKDGADPATSHSYAYVNYTYGSEE